MEIGQAWSFMVQGQVRSDTRPFRRVPALPKITYAPQLIINAIPLDGVEGFSVFKIKTSVNPIMIILIRQMNTHRLGGNHVIRLQRSEGNEIRAHIITLLPMERTVIPQRNDSIDLVGHGVLCPISCNRVEILTIAWRKVIFYGNADNRLFRPASQIRAARCDKTNGVIDITIMVVAQKPKASTMPDDRWVHQRKLPVNTLTPGLVHRIIFRCAIAECGADELHMHTVTTHVQHVGRIQP